MLLDGDPLGGGLDVLLGGETARGLRWPDLAGARGRVSGAELARALPALKRLSALSCLSWDRGDTLTVPPEAMRSVLAAARRRGGLVVVDVPRHLDAAAGQALQQSDLALLVVPAELRAVAAADRVASAARMRLGDVRAVVRPVRAGGLPAHRIARGLRLAALVEAATARQWLASVGRRSCEERLAHLLCELLVRLAAAGRATDGGFELPLTQVDLADATGMTTVHVNRSLRSLRKRKLIDGKGRRIEVLDVAALRELAAFDPGYLHRAVARPTP